LNLKRRLTIAALGVLTIAGVVVFAFWQWGGGTAHAPSPSAAELKDAAAVVNGHVILKSDVERTFEGYQGLAAPAARALTRTQILNTMIDDEVKYEEGVRLKMTPTAAEVDAAIASSREGVEGPGGESQRALVEKVAAQDGLTYDSYWTSPALRDGWVRILTIGKYTTSIFVPSDAYPDANNAVAAKVAELRAQAKVEILVAYD